MIVYVQPSRDEVALDALVGIAGILATVLSLALAAALVIAQHTAERHVRAIYLEFRQERAWPLALGGLAAGTLAILVASLVWTTLSTAMAAVALAGGLGLFAASLFPQLLDSLDPAILARRVTDRAVSELGRIAREVHPVQRESALKPVARRGLEIPSAIAAAGVSTKDPDVVRAGYEGLRRVLIAYVSGSTTRGWDGEVVDSAFQHLGVATRGCAVADPVLLLPAAIEQLRLLGVENAATLHGNEAELVSGRLNSLLVEVATQTIAVDQSGAPWAATEAIGAGALAMIGAGAHNSTSDHIRRLGAVGVAAIRTERDHVAGRANIDLARLAEALAAVESRDVMPAALFDDACEAIARSVDEFTKRTGNGVTDHAWLYVTGPMAGDNLARVVVAGLRAHHRLPERYRSGFVDGASTLIYSLAKLALHRKGGFLTPSYAADSVYAAVLGAMASELDDPSAELVTEWWRRVVGVVTDPSTREFIHEQEMMSSLLLVGVYEAQAARASNKMREALREVLGDGSSLADAFHRSRRAWAWLPAGRAALGSGDTPLAEAIAVAVAASLRESRAALSAGRSGAPWRERRTSSGDGDLYAPVYGAPMPSIPDVHVRPDVIEAFDELLARHDRKRPRRRRTPGTPLPD